MEPLLNFLISKNVHIIEGLILTILIVAFVAGYRWFTAKPVKESAGGAVGVGVAGPDLKQLEETLKKVLEKAGNMQPMVMPVSGDMSAADTAALTASQEQIRRLTAEIGNLKSDLGNKQKMMEEMAKNATAAGSAEGGTPVASGEKELLESQIKELQGKLSEYEIISEDIADLSFYKEQAAKLQKEIDDLKAAGKTTPASAATQASAPVKEPEIRGSAKATQAASVEINPALDDDVLADFAAAVEDQQVAKETPPTSAPVVAAPANAPAEAATGADVDLGSLDMDKMLNEAAGIGDDVPEVSAEQALGTGLDENKILKEASAMDAAVSEEDKNLMGQFENFVKSNDKA